MLIGATFEAWMQWAAGTDPDPASYLVAAVGVLRVPESTQAGRKWGDDDVLPGGHLLALANPDGVADYLLRR